MRVIHVVGARPNFVKAAPVYSACAKHGFSQLLVHTGQHYDDNMAGVFFRELGLPAPDINLEVGSGSHAEQTAEVMLRLERVLHDNACEWVVVYGDVNSTLAAALVCAKLAIPVAHVEAGLRSFDRGMPEEINRLLTDQIADLLFTPSEDANANLLREGVGADKIRLVGNVMIDMLVKSLPLTRDAVREQYVPDSSRYALVTLHRPSNVDDGVRLAQILDALTRISVRLPVVFPVHPRTHRRITQMGGRAQAPGLRLVEPMSYLDFVSLLQRATVVVTDSGGIQEETTFLGVPCLTLRENTERPITVTEGTNLLIGSDDRRLEREVEAILAGHAKAGRIPALWDGRAAERIADAFAQS